MLSNNKNILKKKFKTGKIVLESACIKAFLVY